MSQKQTSAPNLRKTPVATPDRLSVIQDATSELSCIGICLRAMSNGMLTGSEESGPNMSAVGMALEWLASEMQRRCVAIDEGLS